MEGKRMISIILYSGLSKENSPIIITVEPLKAFNTHSYRFVIIVLR